MGFKRHIVNRKYDDKCPPKNDECTSGIQRDQDDTHHHFPMSRGYSLKVAPQQSFLRFTPATAIDELFIF